MFDLSEEGIRNLISKGEGSNVEFKKSLIPSRELDAFANAFLNSEGGIILFGVGDSGEIVGLSEQETKQAHLRFNRVARMMPRAVRDGVTFRYGAHVLDDKSVAFFEVSHKPRRVSRDPFKAFAIESTLLLTALFSLWYLRRFVPYDTLLASILRPFSYLQGPTAVLLFSVALECFFGLVFYGTAYEVTPLKLLGLFFPLDKLIKKLRRAKSDTHESTSSQVVDAISDVEPLSVETEVLYQKGSPLPPPQPEEAAEVELAKDKTDELFREVSERASYLADRMERRTNTYMILGVFMGFIGMGFWFWSFNNALSKPMGLTEFIETAIPRVTILIFIELLAGFFLRQYRIGVEDFKYFFEIEQRADWKRISYSILLAKNDAAIGSFATSLHADALSMKLQAGESTTTLEALKAEGNTTLEALKLMGNTIKDVVQATKPK